ncbi:MAG: hypothetical protein AAFY84_18530, partial [Pseudomonadota bacterium]
KARPTAATAPLTCPLILTGPGDAVRDALHGRPGAVLLSGDRHAHPVRMVDRSDGFRRDAGDAGGRAVHLRLLRSGTGLE